MDISTKLMLVASVILMGYNLSMVLSSYEATCKKIEEFKKAIQEDGMERRDMKRSNSVLVGILSAVYVVLAYFCNFEYWVLGLIALKLGITLWLSNRELVFVFKNGTINKTQFKIGKVDEVFNMILGGFVLFILVM